MTRLRVLIMYYDFPVEITFWRPASETRCKHRNPLFDPMIGVTICCLIIDTLHALNLGMLHFFATNLVWELILVDIYQVLDFQY